MKKFVTGILKESFIYAFWQVLTYDTSIKDERQNIAEKQELSKSFSSPVFRDNFAKGVRI
ncbi:MAG: hypothetical protein ACM3IJ_03600 [Candidatus Levyibacteriota bacterium]